jgi:uncharacterized protein (DUF58 family)
MMMLCAIVLIPAALLFTYAPTLQVEIFAGVLLLLVCLAVDALRAIGSLDSIGLTLPEIVRSTRGNDTSIEVLIDATNSTLRSFTLGLQLPETVPSKQGALRVDMPAEVNKATVEWHCTPSERGNVIIVQAFLGAKSPWGLWEHHRMVPVQSGIRVYPNVQQERKNMAAIFLNRDSVGIHRQRSIERGREFAQLREYIPGDSFEDIHWKATARTGKPVTKLYQVERSQEIYVVIDSSSFSATELGDDKGPTGKTTNLERCINAALILGLVAEKQGDLFGLITFDEQVRTFLKARNGRGHYNACRDALYAVEPSEHHADFAELFSYIRLNLRKRALLIFLTNLSDPLQSERFTENVEIISRNHLIVVNMIADPVVQPVFKSEGITSSEEVYAKLGGHFEWNNLQAIQKRLHLQNITMQFLSHEMLSADLVSQYMTQKQRQLI